MIVRDDITKKKSPIFVCRDFHVPNVIRTILGRTEISVCLHHTHINTDEWLLFENHTTANRCAPIEPQGSVRSIGTDIGKNASRKTQGFDS